MTNDEEQEPKPLDVDGEAPRDPLAKAIYEGIMQERMEWRLYPDIYADRVAAHVQASLGTTKVAVVSYQERYEGGGTLGVFKDVETARAWITKTHPRVVQEPGDNSSYTEGDTFYTIDLMEVRS